MIPPMPTECACALPAHVPPVCAPCRDGAHDACAEPPTASRPELPATFILDHDGYPTLKVPLSDRRLPIPPVVYETGHPHRQPPCRCAVEDHSTTPIESASIRLPGGRADDYGTEVLL